ncbi:MAG: CBS domain-containing protein [Syntrophobacteraceae bacterium]
MKVYEFMTRKFDSIDAGKTVYDAVETMVNKRIRALVVRNPGKDGRDSIFGVLTARDIVFRVLAREINPKTVRVSEIASRPIVCVEKEMEFDMAATLMEKSNIARLFVCEGDNILGVVSLLDVMAAELIMIARGNHDS